MKRILLLAAAMCCISLVSCDNEQDLGKLSTEDLEILEMDELISSQSGFDETALISDLTRGTMKISSRYQYRDGKISMYSIDGMHLVAATTVFFDDGTCWDCFVSWSSNAIHNLFTWRYDHSTLSLITQDADHCYDECSAKVLYYNTENHYLIIEGNIANILSPQSKIEKVRLSGYIDVDPAERERIIEKYCNE